MNMQRILRIISAAVLVIGCLTIAGTTAKADSCCFSGICCTARAGQCCYADAGGCLTYGCPQANYNALNSRDL
jgi:hypothetical protein